MEGAVRAGASVVSDRSPFGRAGRGPARRGAGAVTPGITRSGRLSSFEFCRVPVRVDSGLATALAGPIAGGTSAGGSSFGATSWAIARLVPKSSPNRPNVVTLLIIDPSRSGVFPPPRNPHPSERDRHSKVKSLLFPPSAPSRGCLAPWTLWVGRSACPPGMRGVKSPLSRQDREKGRAWCRSKEPKCPRIPTPPPAT